MEENYSSLVPIPWWIDVLVTVTVVIIVLGIIVFVLLRRRWFRFSLMTMNRRGILEWGVFVVGALMFAGACGSLSFGHRGSWFWPVLHGISLIVLVALTVWTEVTKHQRGWPHWLGLTAGFLGAAALAWRDLNTS